MHALVVAAVAFVARAIVVAFSVGRFPPSADGLYYHTFADRLARGLGYTWAWPDGAVTAAAHYPVGYPALLAPAYRIFGAHASVAMGMNALFGVALAVAAHALLVRATTPRLALAGGLVVALHPALVPYVTALMTEGTTAALVAVACALLAASSRPARAPRVAFLAGAAVLGVAVLVRPQCLVLAPVFGFFAVPARTRWLSRLARASVLTALVLATCAPWTYRNCVRMKSCALVSVNGGWNLLIGEQTRGGAWEEVKVPDECKTVWDEAGKDACFGAAAKRSIAANPASWLARAPQKLAVTFDYFGGAPWYLHQANPEVFPYDAKVALGTVETVVSRLLLVLAVVALARARGPLRGARLGLAVVLVAIALSRHAWPAYLGLVILGAMRGPRALSRGPFLVPASLAVIVSTAALHAVFFGAGRYGLVAAPFVAALGFVSSSRAPRSRGRSW